MRRGVTHAGVIRAAAPALVSALAVVHSFLTLNWRPVGVSTSWRAMSATHCRCSAGTLESHSQSRWLVWAYSAAGVACVTLVVVTKPVCLPADWRKKQGRFL